MDWDNLRFFLETARAGTLAAAARRLEVDHTTVSRRIQALEKSLGRPLFVRSATGFTPTEAGRELLPHAQAMEAAGRAIDADRAAHRPNGELAGAVRIGTTEGFGSAVLAPRLAAFTAGQPRLVIDLLAVPRTVNLGRREADIVVGLERPARGEVIAVRLCDYQLRLYAARSYLDARPPITRGEDLQQHPFVGYIDELLFSRELQYLRELGSPRRFAVRSTSIVAQWQAVAAGAGLGVLPVFLAGADARLRPVLPEQTRFTRTFWMSMPVENKGLPRMQAVWEILKQIAADSAPLLMGGQPPTSDG
ncbi:LysR family transcriptional regulator [Xylophilus rhododendri]|uniref:LysR family transcriptional regulator n=1 Tax=Xylophilus rhododendri TaxID=2697032 RepID=A0A857J9L6_9BURK|nr:LysR family transcriptional regulator [Xylophilus rhododendri]QHI99445.1 LysR family transcriptional regulator [Xylophilus rhododendri]